MNNTAEPISSNIDGNKPALNPVEETDKVAKARKIYALQKLDAESRLELIKSTVRENKSLGVAGLSKIMLLFWEKAFIALDELFGSNPDKALNHFRDLALDIKQASAVKQDELDIMRLMASTAHLQAITNLRTRNDLDQAIQAECEVIDDANSASDKHLT